MVSELVNYRAPTASLTLGGVDNPYAQNNAMLQQQMLDRARREEEERERQRKQSQNNFSSELMDYLQTDGGAAQSTMGTTAGMSSSAGVNAAGGTLQSAMAAPLASSGAVSAAPASTLGGGSVVGPMSYAPASGMTMAGGTAGGAVGTGAGAGTGTAVGAGGAGAGAGAGGGAGGAGAGLGAAAGFAAIPLAVMAYEDNQGINSWNQNLTNPGGSASRRADHFADNAKDLFGDNLAGERLGDIFGGGHQFIMPSSPGDWWDGAKKMTGAKHLGKDLSNLGSSVGDFFSDLFGGWF